MEDLRHSKQLFDATCSLQIGKNGRVMALGTGPKFCPNGPRIEVPVLFVCVEAKRPSQQFFRYVGVEPPLLGITSTFGE